jgi:hypothetical protein
MVRDHHLGKHNVALVVICSTSGACSDERERGEHQCKSSLHVSHPLNSACGDRDHGRRQQANCDTEGTGSPCSKVDGAQGGVFGLAV